MRRTQAASAMAAVMVVAATQSIQAAFVPALPSPTAKATAFTNASSSASSSARCTHLIDVTSLPSFSSRTASTATATATPSPLVLFGSNDDENDHGRHDPSADSMDQTNQDKLTRRNSNEGKSNQDNDQNAIKNATKNVDIKSILRSVGDVIDKAWTYTTFFLGAFLSLGLVLNLCGYGYQVDFRHMEENGGTFLRVDTIERFRTENQWKREALRYKQEQMQQTQQLQQIQQLQWEEMQQEPN